MAQQKSQPQKVSKFYPLHIAIILLLMIGFGFLPPFGTITATGMKVLGLFLGCIYAWTIGEMIWSSILALILLTYTGDGSLTTIFANAYGNQTLLMILFGFLFCYAVSASGTLEIIVKWLLSREFASRGPWCLAFVFFATACIASMITSNMIPVTLILWATFYDVCRQLDIKPYTPYVTTTLVGVAICGYAGSMVPPYGVFPIIGLGVAHSIAPELTVNIAAYCITTFLINVALVPLITLFFKLLCPKVGFTIVRLEHQDLSFTPKQKIVLVFIGMLALFMILPNALPEGNVIRVFFTRLTSLGTMALIPVLMMMVTWDRERIVDIDEGMRHGVGWGLIFLVGTALVISTALVAEGTGIGPMLAAVMSPLLSGHGPVVVLIILCALSIVVTNCINNVVTVTLLMPIAFSYMQLLGVNPAIAAILITFCTVQGVVMPAGSVCGAMLHGNTDWLKPAHIYKWATLGELMVIVATVTVGVPAAMWLVGVFV